MFDPDGNGVEEGVVINDKDEDGNWEYSPKRYWTLGAEYSFLGFSCRNMGKGKEIYIFFNIEC